VQRGTVTLGRFATLGSNVIVLPNVTIVEGAVVGAGSLVNRDLEPWGNYVGAKAKRMGTRPHEQNVEMAERCKADWEARKRS
jgi:acetyltransferase-like isoleucine patch superfamily enzyme